MGTYAAPPCSPYSLSHVYSFDCFFHRINVLSVSHPPSRRRARTRSLHASAAVLSSAPPAGPPARRTCSSVHTRDTRHSWCFSPSFKPPQRITAADCLEERLKSLGMPLASPFTCTCFVVCYCLLAAASLHAQRMPQQQTAAVAFTVEGLDEIS